MWQSKKDCFICIEWHTVANNEKWMKWTGTSKTDIQWINWAYEISDVDCSQNCNFYSYWKVREILNFNVYYFSMHNKQL